MHEKFKKKKNYAWEPRSSYYFVLLSFWLLTIALLYMHAAESCNSIRKVLFTFII